MMKISKAQVEAAIALLREKVALQERLVHTLKQRGTLERAFIVDLCEALHFKGQSLDRYIPAHREHYRAQSDLAEIVLAELKSNLAINEAMLKEAENPSVIVPGGLQM